MNYKNRIDVEKFIEARLTQMPHPLLSWFSQSQLNQIATVSLDDDLERLGSNDLAENYYNYINTLGGLEGVHDYNLFKTRVIDLPELGQSLCGIRFRAMDISQPFVNIAITTHPLSPVAIAKAVDIVKQQFAEFKPKCIRILLANKTKLDSIEKFNYEINAQGRTTKWDKVIIGNQLQALIDNNLDIKSSNCKTIDILKNGYNLELVDIEQHASWYQHYVKSFNELFANKPEILKMTSCADYEDLVEIGRTGGFNFILTKDGGFAGLFSLGLNLENNLSIKGLGVNEKFIIPSLQGQGIGRMFENRVYHHLFEQNLVNSDTVIFGEIDYDNKASLKSAYSNGRIELARHLWVY